MSRDLRVLSKSRIEIQMTHEHELSKNYFGIFSYVFSCLFVLDFNLYHLFSHL